MLPINSIHVLLHRHLSVVALCYLLQHVGILRRMMDTLVLLLIAHTKFSDFSDFIHLHLELLIGTYSTIVSSACLQPCLTGLYWVHLIHVQWLVSSPSVNQTYQSKETQMNSRFAPHYCRIFPFVYTSSKIISLVLSHFCDGLLYVTGSGAYIKKLYAYMHQYVAHAFFSGKLFYHVKVSTYTVWKHWNVIGSLQRYMLKHTAAP